MAHKPWSKSPSPMIDHVEQPSSPLVMERSRSQSVDFTHQSASLASHPATAETYRIHGISKQGTMENVQGGKSRDFSAQTDVAYHSQVLLESYHRQPILNTDLTSYKRKFLGGGTLQAFAKHLDFFFAKKGLQSINSKFPFGMQYAEEIPLPSFLNGPAYSLYRTGRDLIHSLLCFSKESIHCIRFWISPYSELTRRGFHHRI